MEVNHDKIGRTKMHIKKKSKLVLVTCLTFTAGLQIHAKETFLTGAEVDKTALAWYGNGLIKYDLAIEELERELENKDSRSINRKLEKLDEKKLDYESKYQKKIQSVKRKYEKEQEKLNAKAEKIYNKIDKMTEAGASEATLAKLQAQGKEIDDEVQVYDAQISFIGTVGTILKNGAPSKTSSLSAMSGSIPAFSGDDFSKSAEGPFAFNGGDGEITFIVFVASEHRNSLRVPDLVYKQFNKVKEIPTNVITVFVDDDSKKIESFGKSRSYPVIQNSTVKKEDSKTKKNVQTNLAQTFNVQFLPHIMMQGPSGIIDAVSPGYDKNMLKYMQEKIDLYIEDLEE